MIYPNMNYFELFGLPETVSIDKQKLKQAYFALSRQHHPDHAASGDEEQALELSAEVNKGYRILSNEDETIRYILENRGLLAEEDKASLPQEFLMEMLELNEELAETDLSQEEGKEKIKSKLEGIRHEIYEPVQAIIEDPSADLSEERLLRLKDYYLKKKYLKRLAAQSGQKL